MQTADATGIEIS